ncbi:SDR family oxidoreductase [Maridesulfovibrio frigidus]|uniref:SDR family oxidoreductase n=1 Tax=Maridesulfovibrio frigidus TaxID=340956 RepID=UPI0004E0FB75|nr:SDR family oxidoreductase [Maridesulfovibrio frigidus]
MSPTKVAVITAGGSGMGAGAARKLASEGYQVAILSSSGKGEALAKELGGLGFTGSNRSPEDISNFINAVMEKYGRIDVAVNSAGHGPKGDILEMKDEDWIAGMEVYLLNVIRVVRLVTPIMLEQGSGSIVNVSTYACFEPEALFPTSGVFRSGLAAFSKLFADQYAAKGIRINNILPGFIDSLPETDERRNRIPMGRYGKVEEIAEAIAFLASEKSSYITGQNLRVDGGITRSV